MFLSSTDKDYRKYREEIQDVIQTEGDAACFLSGNWSPTYDDTVTKCKQRLLNCNGFILLLGYWYGSIPPGCPNGIRRSITHLEFDWAMERWSALPRRPMAVLAPKPGSAADFDLRAAANDLITDLDAPLRAEHPALLEAFHTTVAQSWKYVSQFENVQRAREKAIRCCYEFRGLTLDRAAKGEIAVDRVGWEPSEAQLGSLGRKRQLDAVEEVMTSFSEVYTVPGACLLVSGDELAGQREFIMCLTATRAIAGRSTTLGRPTGDRYSVPALCQWSARHLGFSENSELNSPEELAALIAEGLAEQGLCLALDHAERFPGGIAGLWDAFWKPLYARLSEMRIQLGFKHRFVLLLADYTGAGTSESPVTSEPANPDFSRLIRLPPLGVMERRHVLAWLTRWRIRESDGETYSVVADAVLKAPSGSADGTPYLVFKRLRENVELHIEEEEGEHD